MVPADYSATQQKDVIEAPQLGMLAFNGPVKVPLRSGTIFLQRKSFTRSSVTFSNEDFP